MTPGDGDLRSRKDAAPCSRRLPRPPAPRSDPAGSARHRGEAGAGPRSCSSRTGPAAERAPRPPVPLRAPPPAASRFLLLAQRKRRHVGAGAAGRAQPGRHYRRFPVRGLGMVCPGVSPPSPHPPPPPAGQASRESQALFLARALPTAGTPAGQDALTQPRQPRAALAAPCPRRGHRGHRTRPTAAPGSPRAPCPQQPSKQGCPCPGESPETPPRVSRWDGAFGPAVVPRAAPRLRGWDPHTEGGAGCGG